MIEIDIGRKLLINHFAQCRYVYSIQPNRFRHLKKAHSRFDEITNLFLRALFFFLPHRRILCVSRIEKQFTFSEIKMEGKEKKWSEQRKKVYTTDQLME